MVKIVRNGVSLSAHAGLNGAELPARVRVRAVRDGGDFAETGTARERRKDRRRVRAGKRSFLAGN